MLIEVLHQSIDYEILGRLQERVYRLRIRDVNHLMERLIEEWCDLDHTICVDSRAVNQSASLRTC